MQAHWQTRWAACVMEFRRKLHYNHLLYVFISFFFAQWQMVFVYMQETGTLRTDWRLLKQNQEKKFRRMEIKEAFLCWMLRIKWRKWNSE